MYCIVKEAGTKAANYWKLCPLRSLVEITSNKIDFWLT